MIKFNLNIPSKFESLLTEIQKGLKNILGDKIDKIILYGSYSNGNFTEESDIDIMVLSNSEDIKSNKSKISDTIVDLSLANDIIISIIVEKTSDYLKRVEYVPFYQNVDKGMVIYSS
jgi:uncharacterized protein